MIAPGLSEITDRGIDGVNPLFARMADNDIKRDLLESTSPFRRGNKIILVPIDLDSHWGCADFDFEIMKLVLFNPVQTRAHYATMDKVINEFFREHVSGLDRIQQRATRQEGTNSCGPLTLLCFQCMHSALI
ncbi:Cysteine protease [Phytophthora megakarya]|uniref:Cysteine protease n=1 Tax=Phytophthora megakarya TaxID=4795 RepID=A0A225WVK0_9STRA|nr:Cysteine protease [Phytophthora megakarya]